jgi:hypothetical protein
VSYSFSARGTNPDEAKAAVAAKFDEIVAQQPIHEADRDEAVVETFIDKLTANDDRDVSVSVNGYVQTTDENVTSICIGVTASLVAREAAAES